MIVFDGWLNMNKAPVVNVMLHVKENVVKSHGVYFLKSFYNGTKGLTADAYCKELKDVMNDFGGSKICAVLSTSQEPAKVQE